MNFHNLAISMVEHGAKHEFVIVHEGDTPENRAAAEAVLRQRGARAFKHSTSLCIDRDATMLESRGYVLEDA